MRHLEGTGMVFTIVSGSCIQYSFVAGWEVMDSLIAKLYNSRGYKTVQGQAR